MKQTLKNALLILAGASCLYCANDSINGGGSDGPVPDASGQAAEPACCEPPGLEAPTVIFDGQIMWGPAEPCSFGPEWDISAFRTVVIHQVGGTNTFDDVLVRHGEGAGYVRLQAANLGRANAVSGGKVQVIDTRFGTSMRLALDCQFTQVTVVGYVNR